jgi:hypothetical protein
MIMIRWWYSVTVTLDQVSSCLPIWEIPDSAYSFKLEALSNHSIAQEKIATPSGSHAVSRKHDGRSMKFDGGVTAVMGEYK